MPEARSEVLFDKGGRASQVSHAAGLALASNSVSLQKGVSTIYPSPMAGVNSSHVQMVVMLQSRKARAHSSRSCCMLTRLRATFCESSASGTSSFSFVSRRTMRTWAIGNRTSVRPMGWEHWGGPRGRGGIGGHEGDHWEEH